METTKSGFQSLESLDADSASEWRVLARRNPVVLAFSTVGIRAVIVPDDMKDLMHKVTEARKAAETKLISRREQSAAMRSQANTASLLADNPVLMRLREPEVLEKITAAGKLNIVLGKEGLAELVINRAARHDTWDFSARVLAT